MDKMSGKDFNRPQYQTLRKKLKEGDVLVIKSLDRLEYNNEDFQEDLRYLTKKMGMVLVDMPILETRTNKDLIGTLISDIVLQLLSYVAQVKRDNIRQRQAEEIAAAKARGVHLGRMPDPIPDNFYPIYEDWVNKRFTANMAAKKIGIFKNQFEWMVRKHIKN